MRYAVLSDIHGNLAALEAVVSHLERDPVDQVVCLGDIVGYGPEPERCIKITKAYCQTVVAGNHDRAVAGHLDWSGFNVLARESVLWTRDTLSPSEVEFLGRLPLVCQGEGFTAVHGSLHMPELFDYVQTCHDAFLSMERMEQPLCFIGHSHVPVGFVRGQVVEYRIGETISVAPDATTIVNVGSVGQPRDRDPRACFGVYDSCRGTVKIRRVPYDVDSVVARVRAVGLPRQLGERLRYGR